MTFTVGDQITSGPCPPVGAVVVQHGVAGQVLLDWGEVHVRFVEPDDLLWEDVLAAGPVLLVWLPEGDN